MPEERKVTVNKILVVVIVLLALLVCTGAVIIVMFMSRSPDSDKSVETPLVEVSEDGSVMYMEMDSHLILDEDDLVSKEDLQKKIDDGKINLRFSNMIYIQNGKDGVCDIGNSSANTKDVYVSLWLVDTQEEIYRSGLMPVGSRIQQLELNRSLEDGDYEGILVYNQLENNKVVGQVNVGVTLKVS